VNCIHLPVCVLQANPDIRQGQKKLAKEVTLLVHGGDNLIADFWSVASVFHIQVAQALL